MGKAYNLSISIRAAVLSYVAAMKLLLGIIFDHWRYGLRAGAVAEICKSSFLMVNFYRHLNRGRLFRHPRRRDHPPRAYQLSDSLTL